ATKAEVAEDKTARRQLRQTWMGKLISTFGDDEGNEVVFSGTVVQALLMMNGEDINKAIMNDKKGTVASVLQRFSTARLPTREAITALYMASLNRPPTVLELTGDKKENGRLGLLNPKAYALYRAPGKDKLSYMYQDLFWALLNSNEFILNH